MNIDQHIAHLLFDHNCVIVPEFGGFVAGYASAKVHVTQLLITPPGKMISFNKNLRQSDGLLANRITTAEGCSFSEAEQRIKAFVLQVLKDLDQKEQVVFNGIGMFFSDLEGNIQFEPDFSVNYLPESFGLGPVHVLPLKRNNKLIEPAASEPMFKDRFPEKESIAKRKWPVRVASTIIVGATVLIVWMPLMTHVVKQYSYSSLNPFEAHLGLQKAATPVAASSATAAAPAIAKAPATLTDATPSAKSELNKPAPSVNAVQRGVSTSATAGRFHLVVGCFRQEENAHKCIADLQAKSFEAKIIGLNRQGLVMVAVGDYPNTTDAHNELSRLKSENFDAWVFEK